MAGCAEDEAPSALDPAGPGADRIATVWWWLFGLGAAVFVLVTACVVVALLRRRPRGGEASSEGRRESLTPIILGGIVLPVAVLPALFVFTLVAFDDLPGGGDAPILVEVVGHQYWWEVTYPEIGIVTANEITIPTGLHVELQMISADVVHSLWVPQLQGKQDLVPGRETELTLVADEAGVYRGQCAEYCGIQHANMGLRVVALTPEGFDGWVDDRLAADPLAGPTAEEGFAAFMGAGCGACHSIQGTEADGTIGPDLTHVASRETLGAGVIPNTRGHLGGWIANSQTIKPGNGMPAIPLSAEELQALIAYLE